MNMKHKQRKRKVGGTSGNLIEGIYKEVSPEKIKEKCCKVGGPYGGI